MATQLSSAPLYFLAILFNIIPLECNADDSINGTIYPSTPSLTTTSNFFSTPHSMDNSTSTISFLSNTSRIPCGTNTWCYYVNLFPNFNISSETVSVISTTDDVASHHRIYIKSNGDKCVNPSINVIFEEIDFLTESTEYFDIYDEDDVLITRCTGSSDFACGTWLTCLADKFLSISQIETNDIYQIKIEGSDGLNTLCDTHHYSLNVQLTITCGKS